MKRRDDSGFTLIEVLFTMLIFGILSAISVFGWRSYERSQEEQGTARTAVSLLRDAQVRAVSEETTFRVDFTSGSGKASLWKLVGASYVRQNTYSSAGSTVTFQSPTFEQPSGGTAPSVYFYPRGAATPGTVTVVRAGSSKTYTITVEGLTGRVSYS